MGPLLSHQITIQSMEPPWFQAFRPSILHPYETYEIPYETYDIPIVAG